MAEIKDAQAFSKDLIYTNYSRKKLEEFLSKNENRLIMQHFLVKANHMIKLAVKTAGLRDIPLEYDVYSNASLAQI